MSNRISLSTTLMVCLGVFMLALPKLSYADRGDRHEDRRGEHRSFRYHDHPSFGLRVDFLPESSFTFSTRGMKYYYSDGIYYNWAGRDYVIIEPPIGAIVNMIPPDYHAVVINGVTYYTDNGTYYVYTRSGYQVVPPPVVMTPPSPVVVNQPAPVVVNVPAAVTAPAVTTTLTADTDDSFTVNIPDSKGGYVPVVLKRSKKGFIGPQGELYQEFPKVSQLKVMYGK